MDTILHILGIVALVVLGLGALAAGLFAWLFSGDENPFN